MIQVDDGEYNERWYHSVAPVCKHWYGAANNCISLWRRVRLGSSIQLVDVSLAHPDVTIEGVRGHLPNFANNSAALERTRAHIMDVSHYRTHGKRSRGCYLQNALRHIGRMAMLVEVLVVHDRRPRLLISEDDSEGYGHSDGSGEDAADLDEGGQNMDITTLEGRFTATLEVPVDPETFPRLQSLTLITAVPTSRRVPLPNLRTLHLYDCIRMSLTMGAFLTLISQCEALEELTLRRFRPMDAHLPASIERDAPKEIDPIRPVALPASLRRVSVQDIAPWTARLLEGMALSKRVCLWVAMHGGSDCLPLVRFWDKALHNAFPYNKAHIKPLRRAHTVRVEMDTAAVRYRIIVRSSSNHQDVDTLTATADNEFVHMTNTIPNFLRDIYKLFYKAPVADLTVAVVGTLNKKTDEHHWAAALQALPRLKRLAVSLRGKVNSSSSDPFVAMLKALSSPCDDGTETCPRLEALSLHFADTHHETPIFPSIQDCLKDRVARGHQVSRLTIMHKRPSWVSADEWAAIEESALEHYKSLFQPYVGTVCCGDASYFFQARPVPSSSRL